MVNSVLAPWMQITDWDVAFDEGPKILYFMQLSIIDLLVIGIATESPILIGTGHEICEKPLGYFLREEGVGNRIETSSFIQVW